MFSKYVSQAEFERSDTAIRRGLSNHMNATQTAKAKVLCTQVLDRIREHYASPIIISSGFRSLTVNALVKGSSTSQHRDGEAADFTIVGRSVDQVFDDIIQGRIPGLVFDQVIHEGGWVHISYRSGRNRGQKFRAVFGKNGATYTPV